MTARLPPRDRARRDEVEAMFADLLVNDVNQDLIGAVNHNDEFSGHGRYFPPWLEHVGGMAVRKGPRNAQAWTREWEDYHLRPYWNPPEAAVVADALAERNAAITSVMSRLVPLLTPAEAEVCRLHYVAGHSINVIARATNRHRGRVTKHLGHIKAKARALAGGER